MALMQIVAQNMQNIMRINAAYEYVENNVELPNRNQNENNIRADHVIARNSDLSNLEYFHFTDQNLNLNQ